MKVRICFTVEVDEGFRRALNAYRGRDGLASRSDIQSWYENNAASVDDDMLDQYETRQVKGKPND